MATTQPIGQPASATPAERAPIGASPSQHAAASAREVRGRDRLLVILLAAAAIGVVLGLGLGSAVGAVVPGAATLGPGLGGLLVGYLGWSVALAKGDELAGVSARLFPKAALQKHAYKVLDTSVIIDGRVADVCESGFLEGTLIVPQFVLRELQQIADSPDGLKRNRGKRGFDVIQRLQRIPKVTVLIHDGDCPQVREVDRKLIELGKALDAKVVTDDYNLSKVAELSGVAVLNLNELANAVKPAVLPGEMMHLYVLKEGKEAGQGGLPGRWDHGGRGPRPKLIGQVWT